MSLATLFDNEICNASLGYPFISIFRKEPHPRFLLLLRRNVGGECGDEGQGYYYG